MKLEFQLVEVPYVSEIELVRGRLPCLLTAFLRLVFLMNPLTLPPVKPTLFIEQHSWVMIDYG